MRLNEKNFPKIELTESDTGIMMMKFKVMSLDGLPTGNGRVYRTPIMQKAVENLNRRIAERGPAAGYSSHPRAGGGEVDDVAHIIQGASIKDGALWVETKILPTTHGKNLQAILKNGGKLGVSIRGQGSTKTNEKGLQEVGDDYEMLGVDFCLDPAANQFASAANVFESAALNEEDMEISDQRYQMARAAGFKGDKAAYLCIYAERKQKALSEVAFGENPSEGGDDEIAEPQSDDLAKALNESIQEKLGGHYYLMDYEDGVAAAFDLNKSEVSICNYSINPDGTVSVDAGTKKVIDT